MTLERLQALIEAYGADPARWPAAERAAAQAYGAREDAALRAVRDDAAWLDEMLASHMVAPADARLQARVAAPALAAAARRPWPWPRRRLWWPSIGFAGAGLAGIAAGMLVVSICATMPSASSSDWSYTSMAFGGQLQNWSDE